VIDVLRKGVEHGALHFDFILGTPSPHNEKAVALFAKTVSASHASCATAWMRQRRALDRLPLHQRSAHRDV